MTKEKPAPETAPAPSVWFFIYYLDHGKDRRYFCSAKCGSYTFRLLEHGLDYDVVACPRDHTQRVLAGYSKERRAVDSLF